MSLPSFWNESATIPQYPALSRDLDVDVAIVGAGITGLTAAYLLKRAGRKVAVIDRDRVGGVDTMSTTAHITCVTDLDLQELVKTFGRDHAQAAWDAGLAGAAEIEAIVREEKIACEWTSVTGYKHAALGREPDRDHLQKEAALARELGFDANYIEQVPGLGVPGIAFDGQAKFHPRKYLAGLAAIVDGDGSAIFESSSCDEVTDEPLSVKSRGFTIRAPYVVIATHTPIVGKTPLASAALLQTKLYLYTSYVIAGRVPTGQLPEALYWDTAEPYHYLRIERRGDHDLAIFGGEDHKTGQVADTTECYGRLEAAVRAWCPDFQATHRWSGQVIETNDGVPFIGETSDRQFAATGFAGNGMTFGTLAAMMARDAAIGVANPWRELFDVGRTKVRGGTWDYLKENLDYPYYKVKEKLTRADSRAPNDLRPGEGAILSLVGKAAAAWRSEGGEIVMLSPKCTHMGCNVAWNTAEHTWDCPCHGSRFKPDGQVMSGPAESPLEPFE